jgi:hypothetical protein
MRHTLNRSNFGRPPVFNRVDSAADTIAQPRVARDSPVPDQAMSFACNVINATGSEASPDADVRGTLQKTVTALDHHERRPDFNVFTACATHAADDPPRASQSGHCSCHKRARDPLHARRNDTAVVNGNAPCWRFSHAG